MAGSPLSTFLLITIFFGLTFPCNGASYDDKKVYIVYMGDIPKGEIEASTIHSSMLQTAVGSRASEVLVHSYKRSFHGFAARLTEQEKDMIAGMDGVVNVFPNGRKHLHTTRSWDFIGFPQSVPRSTVESDVVVGIFDSGVWPESRSFQDDGYGPPPAKFKGICQTAGGNFTCNNKIIGAKYYRADGNFTNDIPSPRDTFGHGTHTASTAAGREVSEASLFNFAKGTARGGVPSARIAVYKMCWPDGCYDADILAAFDDAIADGVDIINLSLGGDNAVQYFNDSFAIGSFHAMKNGILCAFSAGNGGPAPGSVINVAPWTLTVAASTIDRKFKTKVKLGNHQVFEGVSLNTFNLHKKSYPLIYGGDVPTYAANTTLEDSRNCKLNSIDKSRVKGKLVLCDQLDTGQAQVIAEAIGTIMSDGGYKDSAYTFPLPTTYLGVEDATVISRYINSTSKPKATIYKSTELNDESAPYVVSFSSRGPNIITPDILKPDLTAPGVNIIAAYSEATTVTGLPGDNRIVSYNVDSGTSMSCPHVVGAAAYVKSFHPTWSPSALKSALMTTARPVNANNNTDAEFGYGSGQIDIVKATNPGLVYDASPADYINFLCGQRIGTKNLRLFMDNSTCPKANKTKVWDLNYPSFALSSNGSKPINRFFHRTVTNVGSAKSIYNAIVYSSNSSSLYIKVEPEVLRFKSVGQTMSFTVKVRAEIVQESIISGSLTWDDGVHQVRSPVVAHSYA